VVRRTRQDLQGWDDERRPGGATLPRLPKLAPLALVLNSPALIVFLITVYLVLSPGGAANWSALTSLSIFARATNHYRILAWVGLAGAVFASEQVTVMRSLTRASQLLHRNR
jgi:hypothetical protein